MDNALFQMAPMTPPVDTVPVDAAQFVPQNVCAKLISYSVEDGNVAHVSFSGGCDGNLKAISTLVEGMPVETVIGQLSGIRCGSKPTSCADQLCVALREHLENGQGE